jgi:hypothetical protein
MDIEVEPSGWEAEAAEIEFLLNDVAEQLLRHFAAPPAGRIRVRYRPNQPPMTAIRPSGTGDYIIFLNTGDRLWSQFAYQFAHEFCHILCDYERLWSHTSNHWFQESLCELASIFALKQMAGSWQISTDQDWRDFAHKHDEYAHGIINRPEIRLPDGVTLGEWLRVNEPMLRAHSCLRELNALVAVHLLPLVQTSPQSWQSLRLMPATSESFANFLSEWHRACPDEQKQFVSQIADCFGIKNREEKIAERAYELWQQRNQEHGNDLADWFHAERELNA